MSLVDKINDATVATRLRTGAIPNGIVIPHHMKAAFEKEAVERFGSLVPRTDGGTDTRYAGILVCFSADVADIRIT